MATTTNYSWSTPDDTALVKDGALAIRTLGTAIDSTVFTNAGAAINKTIVDAKGDLIVASGADAVARLAVGTNDHVLTADSAATNGVKWAALPAAGGMTLITETSASAAGTLSFTSIPGTYKHLFLVWNGLYTATTGNVAYSMQFNADSGSNYLGVYGGGEGSAAAGWAQNRVAATYCGLNSRGWMIYGSTTTTVHQNNGNGSLWIFNYASTTKPKQYQQISGFYSDDAGGPYGATVNGTYNSNSAITSIDIVRVQAATGTLNNATDTSLRLYGVS
jgi:hypothetical protein